MVKKRKNWIKDAIKHPGALTRKAKAAGMSVSQFINNPPEGIRSITKKQIALAKTLRSFH